MDDLNEKKMAGIKANWRLGKVKIKLLPARIRPTQSAQIGLGLGFLVRVAWPGSLAIAKRQLFLLHFISIFMKHKIKVPGFVCVTLIIGIQAFTKQKVQLYSK